MQCCYLTYDTFGRQGPVVELFKLTCAVASSLFKPVLVASTVIMRTLFKPWAEVALIQYTAPANTFVIKQQSRHPLLQLRCILARNTNAWCKGFQHYHAQKRHVLGRSLCGGSTAPFFQFWDAHLSSPSSKQSSKQHMETGCWKWPDNSTQLQCGRA